MTISETSTNDLIKQFDQKTKHLTLAEFTQLVIQHIDETDDPDFRNYLFELSLKPETLENFYIVDKISFLRKLLPKTKKQGPIVYRLIDIIRKGYLDKGKNLYSPQEAIKNLENIFFQTITYTYPSEDLLRETNRIVEKHLYNEEGDPSDPKLIEETLDYIARSTGDLSNQHESWRNHIQFISKHYLDETKDSFDPDKADKVLTTILLQETTYEAPIFQKAKKLSETIHLNRRRQCLQSVRRLG